MAMTACSSQISIHNHRNLWERAISPSAAWQGFLTATIRFRNFTLLPFFLILHFSPHTLPSLFFSWYITPPHTQGLMDVWISQTLFYCATILTGQDMQVSPLASIQCLQWEKYVNCILSHLCLGWLMKGWVFDVYAPGGELGLCYLIKSQMFLSSSESVRRVFFFFFLA